jgi:hypothetical protein
MCVLGCIACAFSGRPAIDDDAPAKNVGIVQFTAPGSGCSVTFGNGLTAAGPGSAAAALIVSDIEAAHDELIRRGIDASEMWHGAPFSPDARLPGPDPKRTSYGSFFSFNDPDRNTWLAAACSSANNRRSQQGACIAKVEPGATRHERRRVTIADVAEKIRFHMSFREKLLLAGLAFASRKELLIEFCVIKT